MELAILIVQHLQSYMGHEL